MCGPFRSAIQARAEDTSVFGEHERTPQLGIAADCVAPKLSPIERNTMTSPKKAARKTAKKTVGHHHDKQPQANDLRRAYEHMGRLEVLRKSLDSSAAGAVDALTKLARSEINGGHIKSAADLLRASEHLSFAGLAEDSPIGGHISIELERSIKEHFDELTRKADEHWGDKVRHASTLTEHYQCFRKSAAGAFKNGAYHQALEFARAAEALAHVRQDAPHKLERGVKNLQLMGA
jgi:hypothetical protein